MEKGTRRTATNRGRHGNEDRRAVEWGKGRIRANAMPEGQSEQTCEQILPATRCDMPVGAKVRTGATCGHTAQLQQSEN